MRKRKAMSKKAEQLTPNVSVVQREPQPSNEQNDKTKESTMSPEQEQYKDLCMSCHLDYDLGLVD